MIFYAYRPLLATKTIFGVLIEDKGKDVVIKFADGVKVLSKKEVTKVWCKKTILQIIDKSLHL
jgi:hypothetical protein